MKTVTTLALGTLFVLSAGSRLRADSGHTGHRLEGTWRVEVTTEDCATGAALSSFRALLAFAKGGTMSGTTSSRAFAPGQRTSDYGVWRHTGGQTYRAVSEAFILFDSPSAPPAPSLVRGVQRITQTIEVDDDTFVSDAAVRFFNANGDVLVTGCASATGRRMR